jgi:peptidoglycan/xylan/chitin deacetylase (PgdA/CDA1 family)
MLILTSAAGRRGRFATGIVAAIAGLAGIGAALAAPTQVARMEGAQPCVALTFDDGPDPTVTPRLLSVLEEKQAHATFFVVGFRAEAAPDVVIRANGDGNEIGNHTWHHVELIKLGSAAAQSELSTNDALITRLIGHAPAFTRVPFGSLSVRIANLAPRKFVAWSVDTLDWKYFDAARLTRVALAEAQNGGIILMHDLYPTTADALPDIIDGLRGKGFRLVTISELVGGACGGKAMGYDLVGDKLPGTTAVAAAPAPAAAPAKPAAGAAPITPVTLPVIPERPRYKVHDGEDE